MVIYGHLPAWTSRSQAYGLLALAAGEHWGLSPLPALARQAGGKPYFPDAADYSFNLSHSGHLAHMLRWTAPLWGWISRWSNPGVPPLVRRVCSSRELDWLGPEDRETYWSRFTQLWALKECHVKHSGAGLRQPIAQIQVPLPGGGAGPVPAGRPVVPPLPRARAGRARCAAWSLPQKKSDGWPLRSRSSPGLGDASKIGKNF